MTVFVDNTPRTVPEGCTVRGVIAALSPFGDEPVLVTVNGVRVDADSGAQLSEGDSVAIYALIIGG